MRHRYARQLQNVHDDLLRIGSRVEHGLADAMRAAKAATKTQPVLVEVMVSSENNPKL